MSDFWEKALKASQAARLLLDAGDTDGAISRAYYAMFHAARFTLELESPDLVRAKRHGTIIGRFALHVVRGRGLDPAFGRAFNVACDKRLVADYEREFTELDDAREIIEDMTRFIAALTALNAEGSP